MQRFYPEKMSRDVPIESNFRPRPTKPSSGFAHSSQFPPRQIFPPPNPALLPAARSSKQSFLLHSSRRSRFPSSPRPRLQVRRSHPRIRYPPPKQSASPHNSQPSPVAHRTNAPQVRD